MHINLEQIEDVCVVKCFGNIDSDSYVVLKQTFGKIMEDNNFKIVVDLSGVNFISSAGWGIFLGNLNEARKKGGDIRLSSMNEKVKNIFYAIELNEILTFYDKIEDAINSYKKH
jgi:anti-sigma B factor antagonist